MTEQQKAAMRQALEALAASDDFLFNYHDCEPNNEREMDAYSEIRANNHEAFTALRQALEQPAQDDPDLQDKDPELYEQPAYRAVKTFHEGKPVYVSEQPAPVRIYSQDWFKAFESERPAQDGPVARCMEHGECFGGECIYTATQPAQQELENDEHAPNCSTEEFLLRGILASELKCWHRLTDDEAQNLVAFVRNMPSKAAQQEPLTDEQIEQCMKQAYSTVQGRNLEHAFTRSIEAAHGIGEKNT